LRQKENEKATQKAKSAKRDHSFESVAKRIECDMDDNRFREKLGKVARVKPVANRKAK
jgi:hypothetical protein